MKTILATPDLLKIEKISFCSDEVQLVVKTRRQKSPCPSCGWQSDKAHSRYRRHLADLPWEGVAVKLILSARKFFCLNPDCRRRIFCERLPGLAAPYAHKTLRFNGLLTKLGVALGGRPGARMAFGMGIKIGRDALLTRVRRAETAQSHTFRVLGVDDFAFRKGQSYGMILVDQERHQVIDPLPDREAATLANWLGGHSGIEIVTRDRASYYADGIKKGSPQAVQIADRWHLQKNLREALENVLNGHRNQLKKAAVALNPHRQAMQALSDDGLPNLRPKRQESQRTMKQLAEHEEKRAQRVKRYEGVKRLQSTGMSISAIGRQMGMHRETVRQFIRADEYPEARPLIKKRDGKTLKDWFGKVEQSGISELARFAKGLREDEAAIQAAMEYEWSNGQVEGQVNRLKMVKRQMFGRANLDLLKARVLQAA